MRSSSTFRSLYLHLRVVICIYNLYSCQLQICLCTIKLCFFCKEVVKRPKGNVHKRVLENNNNRINDFNFQFCYACCTLTFDIFHTLHCRPTTITNTCGRLYSFFHFILLFCSSPKTIGRRLRVFPVLFIRTL